MEICNEVEDINSTGVEKILLQKVLAQGDA